MAELRQSLSRVAVALWVAACLIAFPSAIYVLLGVSLLVVVDPTLLASIVALEVFALCLIGLAMPLSLRLLPAHTRS